MYLNWDNIGPEYMLNYTSDVCYFRPFPSLFYCVLFSKFIILVNLSFSTRILIRDKYIFFV